MDRNLKIWELSLIVGVLSALLVGTWLTEEQSDLADTVIRLHVVANSDTQADQTLKLAVRDGILAEINQFYPDDITIDEAAELLTSQLDAIAAAGQAVVTAEGYDYPISATVSEVWFPTKEYDSFALPAGTYTALQIKVGQAAGENWWCVAFPPLCIGTASKTIEAATTAGHFSADQVSLITENGEGYVLKFKALELLGNLKSPFW